VLYNDRNEKMQREFAIRQLAKREDYRLETKDGESYRLINERLNVVEQIHRAYIIGRLRSVLDQTDGAIIPIVILNRANQLGAKAMSVAGYTRPGLLCVQCGEPFTLSLVRPDARRVKDLSDPFQATCPECAHEATYRKSDIQIMVPVDGP
jgi:hypothetical protein